MSRVSEQTPAMNRRGHLARVLLGMPPAPAFYDQAEPLRRHKGEPVRRERHKRAGQRGVAQHVEGGSGETAPLFI